MIVEQNEGIDNHDLIMILIDEVMAEVERIAEENPTLTCLQKMYLKMCLLHQAFELHELQ